MTGTFVYHGHTLPYLVHPHNNAALNERTVEVPIVLDWVSRHGLDVEVGNVLGHYGHVGHRVIDKYEPAPGVENLDVMDLHGPVGSLAAISTVEHVGWDEPGMDRDPALAIEATWRLLRVAERGILTVPMGHHPALDQFLLDHFEVSTLVRWWGGWIETAEPTPAPYGATTPWAESVLIMEWGEA